MRRSGMARIKHVRSAGVMPVVAVLCHAVLPC